MKKRINRIVFFLVIFISLFLLMSDTNKLVIKHTYGKHITNDKIFNITIENVDEDKFDEINEDNIADSNKDKDKILESAKKKFDEKYDVISEYISAYSNNVTKEDFAKYIISNYGTDVFAKIVNSSDKDLNRDFYTETGKSLFILLDEFLSVKDYEEKTSEKQNEILITFAGDICLTEEGFVLDYYKTVSGLYECISADIIEKTNKADIFMLNNEFSFSDRGIPLEGKLYTFRAGYDRVNILKELGTDIVSLANNHVYDYGLEAFTDTMECLDNAAIKRVGAGKNSNEAEVVIYYDVNGIKIGIVSASRAEKVRYTPGAKQNSAGIFLMYDMERLLEVIKEADKKCDFLISYIHWGTEDSKYYEEYQREIAKQMIDAGIDAIIGGHPHVLQGIEYIDNVPVIYSLGDFWFNNETKYTALLNLKIDISGIKSLSIEPCLQSNFKTTLISDEDEKKQFFSYIRELSNNCNIDDDGNIIKE